MAVRRDSPPVEPWDELNGKVVMVTGASSGLGREFCVDLARAGCRVIAAARRANRLRSLFHEINNGFGNFCSGSAAAAAAVAVEMDISADEESIEKCVRKAWDCFGFIDALVNNAGFRGTLKSPLELSVEEWNQVVGTNLKGSWLVSKYVCIHMGETKRSGSIINISSIAGLNRNSLPFNKGIS
ncbi:uncharacterized protein LOC111021733 [Momordica charantia]|uniref:Uncharacterized protein LOC111021733 n=1 Tax=Momordica charantia TaxID=3673 RepID=A0A6J1DNS5_MOMCH|nr:uncharacterized protein LOC111021733 [Momordica charantia]